MTERALVPEEGMPAAGGGVPRWVPAAAAVGGALWVVHGAAEILQPLGEATQYRDDLGYGVVTDPTAFVIYGLAGPPALLLTAALLAALRPHATGRGRTAVTALVMLGAVCGVAAVIGVIARFEPPFEAGVTLGRILVSVAALALVRAAGLPSRLLFGVGALGLVVLAARIAVNALEFLPRPVAFLASVAFGAAWVALALALQRRSRSTAT